MGFNIMDLMNGATRAAVEGVDNYEAITLNLDEIKVTKHNRYSMDDLEELVDQVNNVRQLNRKAHIAGVLITDYEKSDTSEAAETWLREKSGLPVFNTIIRHSKKVKDSTFYHKTPIAYCVRSGAAQGYKNFILEYMNKPHMAAEQKERG